MTFLQMNMDILTNKCFLSMSSVKIILFQDKTGLKYHRKHLSYLKTPSYAEVSMGLWPFKRP